MFGYTFIKADKLKQLEERLQELEKKNEYLMMTHYSSKAAREIMDEIREVINCPRGNNITDAIKKLKVAGLMIKDLKLARGAVGYVLSRPPLEWWHESCRQLAKRMDDKLKKDETKKTPT